MTHTTISPLRTRATAIILIATALLLIAAMASTQFPLFGDSNSTAKAAKVAVSSASEGIYGPVGTSPDGRDDCDDFKTARDQYENGGLNNNVEQTFTNYASEFADKGLRYTVGNEDAFIQQMERYCP